MRKLFFNALIYISLAFLLAFLYKYNYIDVKGISFNPWLLGVSCIFLWAGFIGSALGWKKALSIHGIEVSRKEAISSHGLSVFAKFIPGKVWVILGRASKVSIIGHSLKTSSYASLKEQMVYVWLGLIQALVVFGVSHRNIELFVLVLLLIIALTLFNFSGWVRRIFAFVFKKVFKKELDIPRVGTKELFGLVGYIGLYWLLWDIAFWLFVSAVLPGCSILTAFVFPLSVTLGLLAIIVPGGLGVREGLIVIGLSAFGVPVELATAISIAARLWFLSGEVFIFILAFFFFLSLSLFKNKYHETSM